MDILTDKTLRVFDTGRLHVGMTLKVYWKNTGSSYFATIEHINDSAMDLRIWHASDWYPLHVTPSHIMSEDVVVGEICDPSAEYFRCYDKESSTKS